MKLLLVSATGRLMRKENATEISVQMADLIYTRLYKNASYFIKKNAFIILANCL